MLRSSFCDYSDASYILVKGTITVTNTAAADANANDTNKMIQYCAPLTNCISRINNAQVDDFDVVIPMCNLIEYSDNYSKTYEILWQYCRDEQL